MDFRWQFRLFSYLCTVRLKISTSKYAQISFFYGIYIWMNFSDHQPPHFHAWYGDYKVIVNIKDGVVRGEMPGRALRMILEWLDDHRAELMNNWDKAQKGEPLDKIEPLK